MGLQELRCTRNKKKEMKGERCPDTTLLKRRLLQFRDNLSKPIPKIKAMSHPGPAHHPPVSYKPLLHALRKQDEEPVQFQEQECLQRKMLSSAL